MMIHHRPGVNDTVLRVEEVSAKERGGFIDCSRSASGDNSGGSQGETCYGTSISTALGRIGANMSLIIAILIGHLTKDTKNIKKR